MNKVFVTFMALVIAFVGYLFMSTPITDTSEDPVDVAEIGYYDIEKDHIYYIEDLIIADAHSSRTDSDVHYCIVLFYDKYDNMVAVNMPMNPDDEIWDDLLDYLEDDDMQVGDYTVNCYVKAEKDYTYDDVGSYFMDTVWKYELDLGSDIKTIEWRFDYVCDEDGDPYYVAEGSNTVGKVMGVLTIGVAVLILYFGVIRGSKPKTPKAKKAAHGPVPMPPTHTPTQPTYQPAQQSSYAPPQSAPAQQNAELRFSGRRNAAPVAQETPVAQAEPAPEADPLLVQLERYKALRDAGYMTDAEYEEKRRNMLGL